jgi:predicted DNA-binding protein (UPF0251 family)
MARISKCYVTRSTAARVARLYDLLSMRPGPSPIAKRRALAKGWAPPLAWDDDTIDDPRARARIAPAPTPDLAGYIDEIAVNEAVLGRHVQLTKAEKREAARRLARMGLTTAEVGARMGVSQEAAAKLISRHRIAA